MRRAITREATVAFKSVADSHHFWASCRGYVKLRGKTCGVRGCTSRRGFLTKLGQNYPNSQCFNVSDVEATVPESEIEKAVNAHLPELQINDEGFL